MKNVKKLIVSLIALLAIQATATLDAGKQEKKTWLQCLYATVANIFNDLPSTLESGDLGSNLLESLKKKDDDLGKDALETKEQIEKIEIEKQKKVLKCDTPDFKKINPPLSIVHASRFFEPVVLVPKPQNSDECNSWLWNDGKLDENGTTYRVLSNGKLFVSSYDADKKTWVCTKDDASMNYLTYQGLFI